MKKRHLNILLIVLPLAAVILHALPTAAVYREYLGEGYILQQVSGFAGVVLRSGMLHVYGAGVCAGICVVFGVLRLMKTDIQFTRRLRIFAAAGAILRVIGMQDLTLVGMIMMALLLFTFYFADSAAKMETVE